MPLTPEYLRHRRPLRDVPVPASDATTAEDFGNVIVSAAIDAGIEGLKGDPDTSEINLEARISLEQVAATATHPNCVRICVEINGRRHCYHASPL